MMTKRARLEAAIHGHPVDRPPFSLWRHFPVADQDPAELAAAHLRFQQEFDFDFVKISPTSSFCLKDWGADDAWQGDALGRRAYVRHPIRNPEDWFNLSVLAPNQGHLGRQLEATRLILTTLPTGTPSVHTIFSPLAQARNLAGGDTLVAHLRSHPEAVRAGLATIRETTSRFTAAVLQLGVDGLFYVIQHASPLHLSEMEYAIWGEPDDRAILALANGKWLNTIHLHGDLVYYDRVARYPTALLNWHDRSGPDLEFGKSHFAGAVCGGLCDGELNAGPPAKIAGAVRRSFEQTSGRRWVLSSGCVIPIHVPAAHIRAARVELERR